MSLPEKENLNLMKFPEEFFNCVIPVLPYKDRQLINKKKKKILLPIEPKHSKSLMRCEIFMAYEILNAFDLKVLLAVLFLMQKNKIIHKENLRPMQVAYMINNQLRKFDVPCTYIAIAVKDICECLGVSYHNHNAEKIFDSLQRWSHTRFIFYFKNNERDEKYHNDFEWVDNTLSVSSILNVEEAKKDNIPIFEITFNTLFLKRCWENFLRINYNLIKEIDGKEQYTTLLCYFLQSFKENEIEIYEDFLFEKLNITILLKTEKTTLKEVRRKLKKAGEKLIKIKFLKNFEFDPKNKKYFFVKNNE